MTAETAPKAPQKDAVRQARPKADRPRPLRHGFSIGEQLRAKLGPDKFSALEGRLAARTRRGRGRRQP